MDVGLGLSRHVLLIELQRAVLILVLVDVGLGHAAGLAVALVPLS